VSDSESAKGAGAAGVGGGTLVAIIATTLADGPLKTVLIWVAPAATITLSALWIWGRKKLIEYFDNKQAEAAFRAARQAIEQALNNPSLIPEQRGEFERKRVELDQMIIEGAWRKPCSTSALADRRGRARPPRSMHHSLAYVAGATPAHLHLFLGLLSMTVVVRPGTMPQGCCNEGLGGV